MDCYHPLPPASSFCLPPPSSSFSPPPPPAPCPSSSLAGGVQSAHCGALSAALHAALVWTDSLSVR
jgi:hypothetical protein